MSKASDPSVPAKTDARPKLRTGGYAAADSLTDEGLFEGVAARRVLAYLIDVALLVVVGVAVWFVLLILGVISFGLLSPLGVVAPVLLPLAYHTYFIGSRGATPGMHLLGLEVRCLDGRRIEYPQAFIMTVLFYLTVSVTAWLVLLVALFNERRRTLHDFLCGALVLRRS